MPEGAVMDAPVAAPAATSESVSSDISSHGSTTEGTSAVDTGVDPGVETQTEGDQQPKVGGKADLGTFIKDAAKREALKAIDPSLPGLIRDAAFGAQQVRKEFPAGGLKEAIEYRDTVKQMGGVQGIQETKQYLDNYDNLDQLYTEGKPEFVQQIAQGDPEAFERMVPLAIEQFSKQSPEAYQHVMSKVLVATLDGAKFSDKLRAVYAATQDPAAKAALEEMYNSIEGYKELASKIPEKKINPEFQKLEQEKQAWAEQKTKQIESSVNRQSTQYRDSMIAKELKPFAKWEELDDDRKSAVIREFKARSGKIANADESFKSTRLRYLQNGDEEGLAKLERQFLDQHGPQIIPRVAKLFWSNPSKPAPKNDQPQPNGNGKPATPKGFQFVKSMPGPNEIRRGVGGTTRDMLMANQAILNDGRKVQWA
jgi:hypothetical protein